MLYAELKFQAALKSSVMKGMNDEPAVAFAACHKTFAFGEQVKSVKIIPNSLVYVVTTPDEQRDWKGHIVDLKYCHFA